MNNKGFSLLEVLISSVLIVGLFVSATQMFASSMSVHAVVQKKGREQQKLEVIRSALAYEINLAGYRGSSSGTLNPAISTPIALKILSSDLHELTLEYYEDRYLSNPQKISATYSVGRFGLERSVVVGSATADSGLVLEGIKGLRIKGLIQAAGTKVVPTARATVENVVALEVEIILTVGGEDFKQEFVAPIVNQRIKAAVALACGC
jgi:Tfp pilus assembly protein PilW